MSLCASELGIGAARFLGLPSHVARLLRVRGRTVVRSRGFCRWGRTEALTPGCSDRLLVRSRCQWISRRLNHRKRWDLPTPSETHWGCHSIAESKKPLPWWYRNPPRIRLQGRGIDRGIRGYCGWGSCYGREFGLVVSRRHSSVVGVFFRQRRAWLR